MCAGDGRHIEPGVGVARLAVENAAQAETGRQRPGGRQGQRGVRLAIGKAFLDRLGHLLFPCDAHQVCR